MKLMNQFRYLKRFKEMKTRAKSRRVPQAQTANKPSAKLTFRLGHSPLAGAKPTRQSAHVRQPPLALSKRTNFARWRERCTKYSAAKPMKGSRAQNKFRSNDQSKPIFFKEF